MRPFQVTSTFVAFFEKVDHVFTNQQQQNNPRRHTLEPTRRTAVQEKVHKGTQKTENYKKVPAVPCAQQPQRSSLQPSIAAEATPERERMRSPHTQARSKPHSSQAALLTSRAIRRSRRNRSRCGTSAGEHPRASPIQTSLSPSDIAGEDSQSLEPSSNKPTPSHLSMGQHRRRRPRRRTTADSCTQEHLYSAPPPPPPKPKRRTARETQTRDLEEIRGHPLP